MEENYRGIYDRFPMQTALGVYSHRFSMDAEDEETVTDQPENREEETDPWISKETISVGTRDTRH